MRVCECLFGTQVKDAVDFALSLLWSPPALPSSGSTSTLQDDASLSATMADLVLARIRGLPQARVAVKAVLSEQLVVMASAPSQVLVACPCRS